MRIIALLILYSVLGFACLALGPAYSDDRWANADPILKAWFASLMQPDNPGISCCGSSDAYYADIYEVRDGRVIATITDNRGNPVPVGTEIEIPPHKVNKDPNITGHTVLFLSPNGYVFCFLPSTGV